MCEEVCAAGGTGITAHLPVGSPPPPAVVGVSGSGAKALVTDRLSLVLPCPQAASSSLTDRHDFLHVETQNQRLPHLLRRRGRPQR